MDDKYLTPAYWLAVYSHGDQKYGTLPYVSSHLTDVVQVLIDFGFTDDVMIDAGWLHDSLEDTSLDNETMASTVSDETAEIVWAVSGFGINRKARVADILSKVTDFPKAAIVKVADRIANVENLMREFHALSNWPKRNPPPLMNMYRREQAAFASVMEHQVPVEMWERLAKWFR